MKKFFSRTLAALPVFLDTRSNQWITQTQVNKLMADSSIVFVGEQHDHVLGHKMEFDLLKAFCQESANSRIGLSLEMFERDTQSYVTGYMGLQTTERFFKDFSRPWPNYDTDYRPLVEYIKNSTKNSQVIAANIPRRYASLVANGREHDLSTMPDVEKSYMAEEIFAPKDQYWELFRENFKEWPIEKVERYYRAQCIKDDTMAMSIAQFHKSCQGEPCKVFSVTGSFHVNYHLGTFQRVKLRLPEQKLLLIVVLPWDETKEINRDEFLKLADVVVFVEENKEE
ncbi:hypothetical protein AKO1_014295 [Acrasis kona]|uniref:Haem-binding uptake Tiki superfamily ChaN domain-containing protein n=1 Tax=Acrasis kona TaxID=1008807 RepID=A0AAW2Z1C5_9EUKA